MSNTALLLMDLQNGIVERIGNDQAYLDRVGEALAAARSKSIQVIYVVVRFRKDYPEISRRNKAFAAIKSFGVSIEEGSPSTEVHSLLAPLPNEPIVSKRRVGAFSGSDLDTLLRAYEIDHLVLAGISTSGVVLSTLRLAADLDYKITVLSDGCMDRDPEVQRVLTEKVFPNQADVVTIRDWIGSL